MLDRQVLLAVRGFGAKRTSGPYFINYVIV